jgi:hypothetical protein
MKRIIKIIVENLTWEGELFDTECGQAIWDSLPISTTLNTWGDEIYFTIPVHQELDETAKEVVEIGDLGYWPQGPAFCIFFGPTPISEGNEIRPASAVNIIGKIIDNPATFRKVSSGSKITLERKEDA